MSYRFKEVVIEEVTIENYVQTLPQSLALQVENFIPPYGSFDDGCLKRYLTILKTTEEEDEYAAMTLANRLRLAFQDMRPDAICSRFPQADLNLKRRLRCVAEYLIRSGEFTKLRDECNKLIKKRGSLGKLVVIYVPQPKMLENLHKQGLLNEKA
jgi:hypothetical protein